MTTGKPSGLNPTESFTLKGVLNILYQALIQSIEDPFRILDRDYRLLWINQELPCQSIGKICYEDIFQRDSPCPECPVTKTFNTGAPATTNKRIAHPNGTETWYEARSYPVFDGNGNVVYAITIGHDPLEDKKSLAEQRSHIERLQKALHEITQSKLDIDARTSATKRSVPDLSQRELQVLRLMGQGLTNPEMAQILSISSHTVKTHVIRIFDKLGVSDRTQAAALATRLELI